MSDEPQPLVGIDLSDPDSERTTVTCCEITIAWRPGQNPPKRCVVCRRRFNFTGLSVIEGGKGP